MWTARNLVHASSSFCAGIGDPLWKEGFRPSSNFSENPDKAKAPNYQQRKRNNKDQKSVSGGELGSCSVQLFEKGVTFPCGRKVSGLPTNVLKTRSKATKQNTKASSRKKRKRTAWQEQTAHLPTIRKGPRDAMVPGHWRQLLTKLRGEPMPEAHLVTFGKESKRYLSGDGLSLLIWNN